MTENILSIVRARIARLQQDCERLRAKREGALQMAAECDQEIAQNAAKVEALQEVLAVADAAECEIQTPDEPPATPRVRLNGEGQLKTGFRQNPA